MRHWRSINPLSVALLPLAVIFWLAVSLRRWMYLRGWLRSHQMGVPVIVVGNITAGGTGKTPLLIALVKALQQRGYRPGVVSRGYGGTHGIPQIVTAESDPSKTGDEPVLIAWKTGAPVAVGRDRVEAARLLLARSPGVDVILSDDGLQHYRLGRHIELVVIDGASGLGNGWLLPAGPLREPASRLNSTDAVLITQRQGQASHFRYPHRRTMEIKHCPGLIYRLEDPSDRKPLEHAFDETVEAVAGIARPETFFKLLIDSGLAIRRHPFADHHDYTTADLPIDRIVIMTEKDAVKCKRFARPDWWVLEWEARPDQELISWLAEAMNQTPNNISAATGENTAGVIMKK